MSTSLARRATVLLLSLAMFIAFVSTARTAKAEGQLGAGVATILAAESSAGAPIRPHVAKAKAKPAAKHRAKSGHQRAKGQRRH